MTPVVIDTNVIVSALFAGGLPEDVLALATGGVVRMLVTPSIVDEYRTTVTRIAARIADPDAASVLEELIARAAYIEIKGESPRISRDADDDKFIRCALAARATNLVLETSNGPTIITGDKDLLVLNGYEGLSIITPRAFIEQGR